MIFSSGHRAVLAKYSLTFVVGFALLISFQNCGSPSSTTPQVTPPDGSVSQPSDISESGKVAAADTTAQTNPNCTAIAPFYWEIGNQGSVLASGSTGNQSVDRDTVFPIGSATKLVFGAYVIQKKAGVLDANTEKHLKMSAGYTSLGVLSCVFSSTVLGCLNAASNSTYTSAHDNQFYYNGGHFQKLAVDLGLGSLTNAQLGAEVRSVLGTGIDFNFANPQLAGGIETSAQDYATFLQRILSGQLLIKNFLGVNPTCTLPGDCATAISSPLPEAFDYSYGHWVESDPDTDTDGSFSSAGIFGFYPWINSSKTHYGIVSRHKASNTGNEIGSGYASYLCGKLIRKAYFSGSAQ